MTPSNLRGEPQTAHVFNVDLLVESESGAKALERLLHLINKAGFTDYRIKSGIQLGRLIESLEEQAVAVPIPVREAADRPVVIPSSPLRAPESPVPPQAAEAHAPSVVARIKACIATNSLIRIMVNKGYGVRLNIPCRIVNLDETTQMLTVYHVDEKQVYTFALNEIDDFI